MEMALEKKYRSLAMYFSESTNQIITLKFSEIEKIMGYSLPSSAYLNYSWWKKTKAPARHYQAWTAAGYTVKYVQPNQYVVFEKKDFVLENEGHKDVLIIRPALHGDARFLSELHKGAKMESEFLVYGQEQQEISLKRIRQQIIEWNQSGRSVILLAILNGEHVGYMNILGDESERAAHRAEVELVVQADKHDIDILTALIQKSEEWAQQKGIKRFEITMLEENLQARKLFEQNAYEVEGIRKSSVFLQDELQNEVYMGKVFI
ncbi:GNAT family N-acetyltransferase [Planococcus sp. CP5-4]|uniref:GNAT family N-acetyltransferase n=1 Tax=unclassified Planococcus (in: firmicutes) TaxID=2662419 RepID=UPI001C22C19D|nr:MULTISPECIES: GNAT family N-acetyltransferase [unclassified Planococcus (in: firmicutes)]MBU9671838.1 GNAT family N-acetyltransferase [Planococcus sp. CP5-4_YE]MBV0909158.1 GNAT family N-acetyltransferase [Planococcus sp. CP5-4_UN]MBW6063650.1 GNAT family N-acetyltransferase [Planococcus sp. CP5-4]